MPEKTKQKPWGDWTLKQRAEIDGQRERIVGMHEIALLFGIKRPSVAWLRENGKLLAPADLLQFSNGKNMPVWYLGDVVDWAEEQGRSMVPGALPERITGAGLTLGDDDE